VRFPVYLTAILPIAGVALLASGCATRADLLQVQRDQREVRALLADTQVSVDNLRRRVDQLRAQVEESRRGGGRRAVGGMPAGEAADIERRLADIEARLGVQGAAGAQPPLGTTTVPPPGGPAAIPSPPEAQPPRPASPTELALQREQEALQGARVDEDYRDGLRLVAAGQCEQAASKLRTFLRKNPKSDLADNAQYWIGECYYGQKDYNKAIIELNEVLLKYPKGDKVPAALLTLASAFADSGDKIDARLILQKLISDHPKSEEADRGRQKLQALGE
jgi:tol-pal system protein YbgF